MDTSGAHLSRHYLSFQPQRARCLPFAPPGAADADGVQLAHKLLVMGNWNEDDEVRQQPGCFITLLAAEGTLN